MKTICSLRFKEAIAAIQGTKTVMYKHGVWNEYSLCKTEDAIKEIQRSVWSRCQIQRGQENVLRQCASRM